MLSPEGEVLKVGNTEQYLCIKRTHTHAHTHLFAVTGDGGEKSTLRLLETTVIYTISYWAQN